MALNLALQARQLTLSDSGGRALCAWPLDQGGRYRAIASDAIQAERLIKALETAPGVTVLSADGGLLGGLTVAANLSLALRHGHQTDAAMVEDWERTLQLALGMSGFSRERMAHFGRAQPAALDRVERWLVGLLRNLLRPPELLVLDRVFTGLSRQQVQAMLALHAVYQAFHPFRPTLFVDLDTHELPPIPECRHSLRLEGEEVPCRS